MSRFAASITHSTWADRLLLILLCCSIVTGRSVARQVENWTANMADGERLFEQKLFSAARLKFEAAVNEAERSADRERLPSSLNALGRTYTELRLLRDAEQLQRRALSLIGEDHPLRATILSDLATALLDQRDTAGARDLYKQARDYRQKTLGKDHPLVGVALAGIAASYFSEHRLDEAAALYSQAFRQLEHSAGPDDRRTLNALSGYAATLAGRLDYRRAAEVWKGLLARFERVSGPKHEDTLAVLILLASMYALQEKPECLGLYDRAVSVGTDALGSDHPTTAVVRSGFSACLAAQKRPEQAFRQAELAALICQSGRCPDVVRAGALVNLANAHLSRRGYLEAQVLFAEALSLCHGGDCSPLMQAGIVSKYANVLRRLGRRDDARRVESGAKNGTSGERSPRMTLDVLDLRHLEGPGRSKPAAATAYAAGANEPVCEH